MEEDKCRSASLEKKYGDIKVSKAKYASFMQFFVRNEFHNDVYKQLIETIDEATEENGSYKEIKPIPFKTLHYPGNEKKGLEPRIDEDLVNTPVDLTREASNGWLIFSGKDHSPDPNHETGWAPASLVPATQLVSPEVPEPTGQDIARNKPSNRHHITRRRRGGYKGMKNKKRKTRRKK